MSPIEQSMKPEKDRPPSQSILVVDDEVQVCEILSDALSAQGHKVVSAADGQEAIDKLAEGQFSIVITDMDMPRMDGMQLIEFVVKSHPEIDIIAITGHIMKYRYTDVVSAGAADFITKPFTLNELEAKLKRLIRERVLREQLEKLAVRDPLTGLSNRRSFEENARKEAIRAVRYQHPLFMFFLDLDNFKQYNDLHGHQAGDRLLVETASLFLRSFRENVDSVFRYGGDEFVALLPHLPAAQALSVAERIREKFKLLGFEPTSLSIGIASFIQKLGSIDQDIQDMILRADAALYHAKQSCGKNTVYVDSLSR